MFIYLLCNIIFILLQHNHSFVLIISLYYCFCLSLSLPLPPSPSLPPPLYLGSELLGTGPVRLSLLTATGAGPDGTLVSLLHCLALSQHARAAVDLCRNASRNHQGLCAFSTLFIFLIFFFMIKHAHLYTYICLFTHTLMMVIYISVTLRCANIHAFYYGNG